MPIQIKPFHKEDYALFETRSFEARIEAGAGGVIAAQAALFEQHPGWTAWDGGQPVFAAGVVVLWPGVAELWMRSSAWVEAHPLSFHRVVRDMLEGTAAALRLWRVHVHIEVAHKVSQRWIARLGFVCEGARRSLGPNGEDFLEFSKLYPERFQKGADQCLTQ